MKRDLKIPRVTLEYKKLNDLEPFEMTQQDLQGIIDSMQSNIVKEVVEAEEDLLYKLTIEIVGFMLISADSYDRYSAISIEFLKVFIDSECSKLVGGRHVDMDNIYDSVLRILVKTHVVMDKQYASDKYLNINRDFLQKTNMTANQIVDFAIEEILRNEKYRKLDNDTTYMNCGLQIICGELSRELRTLAVILGSMYIIPNTLDIFQLFAKTKENEFRIGKELENQMMDIHEEKIVMNFIKNSAIEYLLNNFDETQFETPKDYHNSQVMQTIHCIDKKSLTVANFNPNIYMAETLLPRNINPSIRELQKRFKENVDKESK